MCSMDEEVAFEFIRLYKPSLYTYRPTVSAKECYDVSPRSNMKTCTSFIIREFV